MYKKTFYYLSLFISKIEKQIAKRKSSHLRAISFAFRFLEIFESLIFREKAEKWQFSRIALIFFFFFSSGISTLFAAVREIYTNLTSSRAV